MIIRRVALTVVLLADVAEATHARAGDLRLARVKDEPPAAFVLRAKAAALISNIDTIVFGAREDFALTAKRSEFAEFRRAVRELAAHAGAP